MEEEGLGIWNFIHGTGAGCASILTWEGMRHFAESGGALIAVYGVLTVGIMHIVHRHRVHLKRERRIGFATDTWDELSHAGKGEEPQQQK